MSETLTYALNLTGVGLAIVFLVLTVIVIAVAIMRKLDDRWQAHEKAKDAASFDRTPTIDATTAVIIAAAVATYVGGRTRVRSVRRLMRADAPTSAWSGQGRAVLQGSHVITGRHSR
jgi:Na+-transporting methylmalonyl-CoA/oxaloacetate decarboxylase gamma subunit